MIDKKVFLSILLHNFVDVKSRENDSMEVVHISFPLYNSITSKVIIKATPRESSSTNIESTFDNKADVYKQNSSSTMIMGFDLKRNQKCSCTT